MPKFIDWLKHRRDDGNLKEGHRIDHFQDRDDIGEDLKEMLAQARRPGALLKKKANQSGVKHGGSWIGGLPQLPAEIDWPWFELDSQVRVPMHFFAQLDLEQLPVFPEYPELPSFGTLFFFFDPILSQRSDFKGGSKVFYTKEEVHSVPFREMPHVELKDADLESRMITLSRSIGPYPRLDVELLQYEGFDEEQFPSEEFRKAALEENRRAMERASGTQLDPEAERPFPDSRLLVLHNMMIGPNGGRWQEPLLPLLSIWSDPDIEFVFGDHTAVVFCIDQSDLVRWNFDAVTIVEGGW